MSDRLDGARISYRLRRVVEQGVPLDVVASVDECLDDLCRREPDLGAAEVLRLAPYFATLWPSARALAAWLASRGTCLEGQVVVEIGCGLALPAIVAARLGARVVAADRHPDVPAFLARNAALSSLAIDYTAADWTDPAQIADLRARLGRIDLVVASDILYEAELATTLAPAIDALCGPDTLTVLADPGRPHLQLAVNLLERRGFAAHLEIVRVTGHHGDRIVGGDAPPPNQEIFVFELSRRRP